MTLLTFESISMENRDKAIAQFDEFARRWAVPNEAAILQDWKGNLLLMRDDCECHDGYHRLWGGLRLLGRHLSLYWEAEQLRELLLPLLKPAKTIVLGGSADQHVLALLSDIAGDNTGKHYHLIDRCPAPAAIAQAYAAQQSLTLSTYQQDLTSPLPVEAPVDLAFMHFTLDFMDQQSRAVVLQQLARCLAPEGRIVVVHRRRDVAKVDVDVSKWAQDIRAQFPDAVLRDPQLAETLDNHLRPYGESWAARALDHGDNRTILALIEEAGLQVLTAEPTMRAQMLTNCDDPIRAGEHGTVYVVGHTKSAHDRTT